MSASLPPTRRLRLRRPIVSFDLESTGLDVQNDRIVEIGCIKLLPTGERQRLVHRVNPDMPIPAAASAVHGIVDADVAHAPRFAQIADEVTAFCHNCDLTGFNIERFDIPLLRQEFARLQQSFPPPFTSVVDSCRIFFRKEPRDLSAALRFYCNTELVGAHGADADATAALDVLLGQVARYDDLPQDVYALHEYTHPKKPEWLDAEGKVAWSAEAAVLTFGKHRNKSLQDLAQNERDYLRWLAHESNMPSDVKSLCADALNNIFPVLDATVRAAIAAGSAAPSSAATAKGAVASATKPPSLSALPLGKQGSLF